MAKESMTEVQQREGDEIGEATLPQCRHHWVIETPQGATSQGVCKLCGADREFRNAAPGAYWEDDSGSTLSRWGRRPTTVRPVSDEDEVGAAPRSETALIV